MSETSRVTQRVQQATQGLGNHMVDFLHQGLTRAVIRAELGVSEAWVQIPASPLSSCLTSQLASVGPRSSFAKRT